LGIDISEGMVQIYNGKANKEGLSDKMKAICADITSEPNPIAGRQFDYVVVRLIPSRSDSVATSDTLICIVCPCVSSL